MRTHKEKMASQRRVAEDLNIPVVRIILHLESSWWHLH